MKLAPHKQWWFMAPTVHIPSTGVIKHPGAPSAGATALLNLVEDVEDRQVQRDDHAAEYDAEEGDHEGFDEGRE